MKSVSFRDKVKVRWIRNVADISKRELKRRWYSREDFERMRDHTKELSERLSSLYHFDVLCSRGLTPPDARQFRHAKLKNCRQHVLMEQEEQLDGGRGVLHPIALARISSFYTRDSVNKAIKRGAIIQQQVRDQERKSTSRRQLYQRSVSDTILETETRDDSSAIIVASSDVTVTRGGKQQRRGCLRRSSSDTTKQLLWEETISTTISTSSVSSQRWAASSPQQSISKPSVSSSSSFHRWRQLSASPVRLPITETLLLG